MGIGTNADANTPTRVGTENNWKRIASKTGYDSSAAIKTDTSMFSWGSDAFWQLGNNDGTATGTNIPTQVTCMDNQVLSVNDINTDKAFSIYPNPAKDFVVIQSVQAITGIKIYSTSGRLVKSITNVSHNKINVSDLLAGVYFVKINDSVESIKFIKK